MIVRQMGEEIDLAKPSLQIDPGLVGQKGIGAVGQQRLHGLPRDAVEAGGQPGGSRGLPPLSTLQADAAEKVAGRIVAGPIALRLRTGRGGFDHLPPVDDIKTVRLIARPKDRLAGSMGFDFNRIGQTIDIPIVEADQQGHRSQTGCDVSAEEPASPILVPKEDRLQMPQRNGQEGGGLLGDGRDAVGLAS